MAVNIRKLFRANCGPKSRYLRHVLRMRDEYPVVMITFRHGKRTFELDGVIHQGETPDARLTNAVLKIAGIAKNLKAVLDQGDGAGQVKVERTLS